jgi:hypothetical protein
MQVLKMCDTIDDCLVSSLTKEALDSSLHLQHRTPAGIFLETDY